MYGNISVEKWGRVCVGIFLLRSGGGGVWELPSCVFHLSPCCVDVDRFYIALFSALEMTCCIRMLFYIPSCLLLCSAFSNSMFFSSKTTRVMCMRVQL